MEFHFRIMARCCRGVSSAHTSVSAARLCLYCGSVWWGLVLEYENVIEYRSADVGGLAR